TTLVKQFNAVPGYQQCQQSLASTESILGSVFHELGMNVEARRAFEHAIEIQQELVRREMPDGERVLAGTRTSYGRFLTDCGAWVQARQELQGALDTFQRLDAQNPNDTANQIDLGTIHVNLGVLFAHHDKWDDALSEFKQARDVWKELAEKSHGNRQFLFKLA